MEENQCTICGKIIDRFSLYCKDVHCQQKYERKLAIVHSSRQYRLYITIFKMAEEEAMLRGDLTNY